MTVALVGGVGPAFQRARAVLADLGAEATTVEAGGGPPSIALLSSILGGVDGVVVLLVAGREQQPATFLEIGFAAALGKSVLILSEETPPPMPAGVIVTSAGVAGLTTEVLRFHLQLFLARLAAPAPAKPASGVVQASDAADTRRLYLDANMYLHRWRDLLAELPRSEARGRRLARVFEAFVENLLRDAGAELWGGAPEDRGFDFAMSVPGLDQVPGVVVVEVKQSSSPRHLLEAALAVQYVVLSERAGLGVILYDDTEGPAVALQTVPMVVVLGLTELLQSLQERTLAQALGDARAEAVGRL